MYVVDLSGLASVTSMFTFTFTDGLHSRILLNGNQGAFDRDIAICCDPAILTPYVILSHSIKSSGSARS